MPSAKRTLVGNNAHGLERKQEDFTEADWLRRGNHHRLRIFAIQDSPMYHVASRNSRWVLPDPPDPMERTSNKSWDWQYRQWRDAVYFIFYDFL